MPRIGTVETKTRTRTFDEGHFRGYTEYLIESETTTTPAPQAFLVHQQPGWVLPIHFHLQQQFQVVTRGHGTLGKQAVAPFTVHYSSREAGYGPLVAGEDGLDYLTLRAIADPGAWYLPEAREQMRKGLRKRHVTVGPIEVGPREALLALPGCAVHVLIEPDETGLAAWRVQTPPGAACAAPEQVNSGGRFHIVMGGTARTGSEEIGMPACVWCDGTEGPPHLVAGEQGLDLLVLQYPAAALDPRALT